MEYDFSKMHACAGFVQRGLSYGGHMLVCTYIYVLSFEMVTILKFEVVGHSSMFAEMQVLPPGGLWARPPGVQHSITTTNAAACNNQFDTMDCCIIVLTSIISLRPMQKQTKCACKFNELRPTMNKFRLKSSKLKNFISSLLELYFHRKMWWYC